MAMGLGNPFLGLAGAYAGHKMQSRKAGEKAGLAERAARVAINPVGWAAGKVLSAPATIGGGMLERAAQNDPSMLGKGMRGLGRWTKFTGEFAKPLDLFETAEGFKRPAPMQQAPKLAYLEDKMNMEKIGQAMVNIEKMAVQTAGSARRIARRSVQQNLGTQQIAAGRQTADIQAKMQAATKRQGVQDRVAEIFGQEQKSIEAQRAVEAQARQKGMQAKAKLLKAQKQKAGKGVDVVETAIRRVKSTRVPKPPAPIAKSPGFLKGKGKLLAIPLALGGAAAGAYGLKKYLAHREQQKAAGLGC